MKDSRDINTCGCCEAPAPPTPEEIKNRPGLSAIRYRVGAYASFRQAMIEAIARQPELRGWTARTGDDYGIALLEMWAYLSDILTFYQERIANESFLRTALLRESVLRLAALLDYEPAPGVAATAYLAFTLEKDKQVKIPVGLRVQSVPGQDEKPQKFETVAAVTADAGFNRVRVFPVPQFYNPLAQSSDHGVLLSGPKGLAPGDKLVVFDGKRAEPKEVAALDQQDDQYILTWTPPILNGGRSIFTNRMFKYNRQMRMFGYNAPTHYLKPEPKVPGSTEIKWTEVTESTLSLSSQHAYDLDARYEDLKPGTQLLVIQSGKHPFARLVTVTAVNQQQAVPKGLLQDTVTNVSLVRNLASAPAASSWATNRLDVFAQGADNALLHKWRNGSKWSDWESLGGMLTSAPAAVSWGPNRIDVFVRGIDNALWHKWWGGSKWSDWESLGGMLTSAPAVSSWAANRLDVFVRGPDNALWHKWWNGSKWSDWESLGGMLTSAPAAVSWGPNRIDVFVRGIDNRLWHKWWGGSKWSNWESLGGILTSAPAVSSWTTNRLNVFVRGADNALWHKWWDGIKWSDWELLGGVLTSAPAAVSWGPNRIDVFSRGTDNSLWRKYWNGIKWSIWESLGIGLGSIDNLRQVVIYELDDPGITFWNRRYPDTISGNTVCAPLSQLKSLEPKRTLILDDKAAKPQTVTVTAASAVDTDGDGKPDHLAVTFTLALKRSLDSKTAVLYGNVAKATHGETVAGEILGSGDASTEFQSFAVKKSPVTFVPKPGASHGAANTLEVRAGGVLWHAVKSLYGRKSDERIYTTAVGDDDTMTVQFGDGVTGARLPSGRNNVVATYRQGLGRDGNVKASSLTTLLDRPVGLKGVTNPGAGRGGAGPESLEKARTNAPNTVRTFGRIVSLRDFEDAAREFTGVAKTRATWVWDGEEQVVHLTVAGDKGDPVTGETHKNLVKDLNSRRDPNRKLLVDTYRKVPVEIEAVIQVHSDYVDETVRASAEKALQSYFAFGNLDLGQPIHLSDVYRVLQDVKGVVAVDINRLQFKKASDRESHGATPEPVQGHLRIYLARVISTDPVKIAPAELAIIESPATDIDVTVSTG